MAEKSLKEILLECDPVIMQKIMRAQMINDVLDDMILEKQASKTEGVQSVSVDDKGNPVDIKMPTKYNEYVYLPKGRLEPMHEYAQRIAMTPWLPVTPSILSDRQGALFSTPPQITGAGSKKLKDFEQDATGDGKTFLWVLVQISEQFMRNGFCAIFTDKAKLPVDVEEREGLVTVEEANKRKLGMPRCVLYEGCQVLKAEFDDQGLSWVKVKESSMVQPTWDSDPVEKTIVRVIDRVQTRSWTIIEDEVIEEPAVPHDADGKCPVVIAHAFSKKGEHFGKPTLRAIAQCDVAGTRLLSDIIWTLFVLGNPILTLTTDRKDEELDDFTTGAGRYIKLKNTQGGLNEPESLSFVQLDSSGIDLMIAMYERFIRKARELSGKNSESGEPIPSEQSGISKAWSFKTGEERELFTMVRQLSEAGNAILDLVADMMDVDPDTVKLVFNENFEVGEDKDSFDITERIMKLAEQIGLETPYKTALRELCTRLKSMTDEELEQTINEIKDLKFEKKEPEVPEIPGQIPPGENPDDKDEDEEDEEIAPDDSGVEAKDREPASV